MTLGRTGTRTLRKWDPSTPRMMSAVRSGKLSAEVDGKLGTSAEAARTSTRKGIAKYDAKELDFGMEEKSKEDEDVGNNAKKLSEEVEGTKVANPFAMKAQRLHPRWPSVPAFAHVCTQRQDTRGVFCSADRFELEFSRLHATSRPRPRLDRRCSHNECRKTDPAETVRSVERVRR